jgi:hypothetical protein
VDDQIWKCSQSWQQARKANFQHFRRFPHQLFGDFIDMPVAVNMVE